ncbi:MAG: PEP-CTERM sorting domain-containing protein [Nitrospirae bacterium]|nr:PEP-CTERM sorting domain-containing protein [Nitrospirota bacterium]
MKKIILCVFLCIGIVSYSSFAAAGVNEGVFVESAGAMSATWGWDPENLVPFSWAYDGDYWDASLSIADGVTTWDVTWMFNHVVTPHEGETSNPFAKTYSFSKDDFGLVISDSDSDGLNPIDADHDFLHADYWQLSFTRDDNPANTVITLDAVHVAPEPASTMLFLTGAVMLGVRRFIKKKNI